MLVKGANGRLYKWTTVTRGLFNVTIMWVFPVVICRPVTKVGEHGWLQGVDDTG